MLPHLFLATFLAQAALAVLAMLATAQFRDQPRAEVLAACKGRSA